MNELLQAYSKISYKSISVNIKGISLHDTLHKLSLLDDNVIYAGHFNMNLK